MSLDLTNKGKVFFGAGLAIIAVSTFYLVVDVSLSLPPLTLDGILHWLFGPGFFVWFLVAAGFVAWYILKPGMKKESKEVPIEVKPAAMSIEEYLDSQNASPENQRMEEEREKAWAASKVEEPQRPRQAMPDTPQVVRDPSMERVSQAFDIAKERMIEEFADAVSRMKFEISLPERVIVETSAPREPRATPQPPPSEE